MQYSKSLLLILYKLQCVTHQCLCCTLQCIWSGWHSLHQVSHSGRSHPLHLFCGSSLPPSHLYLCRNPSWSFDWELGFHWGRTSTQRNKDGCNKNSGQFCRAVPHPLHQCPQGSQDYCSGMLGFWVRTADFFHLRRIRYECVNVMILCIGSMFKHNAQCIRGDNFSLCACDW